jgi:hypothetical protein
MIDMGEYQAELIHFAIQSAQASKGASPKKARGTLSRCLHFQDVFNHDMMIWDDMGLFWVFLKTGTPRYPKSYWFPIKMIKFG